MELKDFIRDTLLDIIQGVKEAQDKCKDTDALICPRSGQVDSRYIRGAQMVCFNIILGGEESATGSFGLKVLFPQFGFQIGKTKDENQRNSEQTSVSFTVPLYFTAQGK